MKKGLFTVTENTRIANGINRMVLSGDASAVTAPGQFINIALDGFYLRRPVSVCDCGDGFITIIYKIVGRGTEYMSTLSVGSALDVLSGLGNGFDADKSGNIPLLIGGGVGIPPMYYLAKKLLEEGKSPVAVLGFNSVSDVFLTKEFAKLGVVTHVSTVDGSLGQRGFVTDVIRNFDLKYSYFYACGPEPMLKAVCDVTVTGGELCLEERMGCGFGACMGCSCKTKYGSKRICREGPVLEKEEIIW